MQTARLQITQYLKSVLFKLCLSFKVPAITEQIKYKRCKLEYLFYIYKGKAGMEFVCQDLQGFINIIKIFSSLHIFYFNHQYIYINTIHIHVIGLERKHKYL